MFKLGVTVRFRNVISIVRPSGSALWTLVLGPNLSTCVDPVAIMLTQAWSSARFHVFNQLV